jgi:glucose-6-phosphate isomerase
MQYAAIRFALYSRAYQIEIMSTFSQSLRSAGEWWKQLFGESEGKDGKGLFPASAVFSTDLHSMGQLVQDGRRNLFETFLWVEKSHNQIAVPALDGDPDGLNYLAGKDLHWINTQAFKGTAEAHTAGNVPNLSIRIPKLTPFALGQLFYFFEYTVAISGYLLGVNPFDQPGVEAYKKAMAAYLKS